MRRLLGKGGYKLRQLFEPEHGPRRLRPTAYLAETEGYIRPQRHAPRPHPGDARQPVAISRPARRLCGAVESGPPLDHALRKPSA